jgi:PAS domain S-box-containing protein
VLVQLAGDTAQRVVQMRSMRVPLLGPQGMLSWLIPAESLLGQSLTSSQALLSHLVATSPDVITLTDLQTGRYVMVNPTFERITGLRAADVLGRTSGDLGIWHDSTERQRLVEALRERDTAQDLPATFRVRDGQLLHMQLSASRFTHEGSDYLVINARDITRSEQLRREYEAVLDTALFGIAVTRDAHFQMVNPRFEAMLGWPAGRLQGMHASQVWPTPTEHAEARARLLPRLEAGEHVDEEVRLKRRDGSLISCRLLAQAVHPSTANATASSGWPRTSPSGARWTRTWRVRATRPRPPTGPRAPSWPTPATSCAPRSTPCWAWPGWPATRAWTSCAGASTSRRSATAPRPSRPSSRTSWTCPRSRPARCTWTACPSGSTACCRTCTRPTAPWPTPRA